MAKRVLIVEDDELTIKLFSDLLRTKGHEVEAARDGNDVLTHVQALQPDLIVMDIQLPNVSGIELIERLKEDEQLKAIPIMAVTVYATGDDRRRIRAAGAEVHMPKPVSVDSFLDVAEALLTFTPNDPLEPDIDAGHAGKR